MMKCKEKEQGKTERTKIKPEKIIEGEREKKIQMNTKEKKNGKKKT